MSQGACPLGSGQVERVLVGDLRLVGGDAGLVAEDGLHVDAALGRCRIVQPLGRS